MKKSNLYAAVFFSWKFPLWYANQRNVQHVSSNWLWEIVLRGNEFLIAQKSPDICIIVYASIFNHFTIQFWIVSVNSRNWLNPPLSTHHTHTYTLTTTEMRNSKRSYGSTYAPVKFSQWGRTSHLLEYASKVSVLLAGYY